MAPPAGLEPTLSESKSDMLPLHNGGIKTRRITLLSYLLDDTRKSSHNRTRTDNSKIKSLIAVCVYLVRVEGLEPPASCSQSRQSTTDLHPDINKTLTLYYRFSIIKWFCCMSLYYLWKEWQNWTNTTTIFAHGARYWARTSDPILVRDVR